MPELDAAGRQWAKHALPSQWNDLIQQVLDDRALGWDRADSPRTGTVAATIAFSEYAKERAADSLP